MPHPPVGVAFATPGRATASAARRLHGLGERPTEIAKQLGAGHASVHRVLEGAKVRAGGRVELPAGRAQ
jgi:hypothetical protein